MLLSVSPTGIEQRCDACGARHSIPIDQLRAGVEIGDPPQPADPNIIALPACSACGGREFLNRVAASDPGGGDHVREHRRGVNALHAVLVERGLLPETLRDHFAREQLDTERGALPWTFPFEPLAVVAAAPAALARFLAGDQGGE